MAHLHYRLLQRADELEEAYDAREYEAWFIMNESTHERRVRERRVVPQPDVLGPRDRRQADRRKNDG